MVNDLYDALRKVGLDEEAARKAAQAVLGAQEKEQLVTKDFLRAEINGLRGEMNGLRAEIQAMLNRQLQIMMGLMIAMTGIFAAIVKLL